MNKNNFNGWVLIPKTYAKDWYNSGRLICLCSDASRPNEPSMDGYIICSKILFDNEPSFDLIVNNFTYYITKHNLGNLVYFYARENDIIQTNDILTISNLQTIKGEQ